MSYARQIAIGTANTLPNYTEVFYRDFGYTFLLNNKTIDVRPGNSFNFGQGFRIMPINHTVCDLRLVTTRRVTVTSPLD